METLRFYSFERMTEGERDALAAAVHFAYGDDYDGVLRGRDIDPPVAHALLAMFPLKVAPGGPLPDSAEPLNLPDWTHEAGRRFAAQYNTDGQREDQDVAGATMEREALAPCPFCGAVGEELGLSVHPNPPIAGQPQEWGVQCLCCHVETPYHDSEPEVVAAWNRRAGWTRRPSGAEGLNPATDDLVTRFADALRAKLRKAELKYGYTDGWADANWQADCVEALREHIEKGDPLDVAAYAAFCWHHRWPTCARPNASADAPPPKAERE